MNRIMLLVSLVAFTVVGLFSVATLAQPPANPRVIQCGNPPGPLPEDVEFWCASQQGGTYAFSIIASPSVLNPVTAEDTASLSIQDQWLGTFFTAYSLLGDGIDTPMAAEKLELSEDGTKVTATLRTGLQFSDGSPASVDDLLYWWFNVVQNPNLPNSWADAYRCTDGNPFTITPIAPNQVQISCPAPFRVFPNFAAAQAVLSKQMAIDLIQAQNIPVAETNQYGPVAAEEFMGLGAPLKLLRGLGPYKMTYLDSAALAKYSPNPYFYEVDSNGVQLPYLGEVNIIIIPTAGLNLSLTNFLNGQSQVYGPRPQDISVILSAAGPAFQVNRNIDAGIPVAGETFTTPNFNDPDPNLAAAARNTNVRRALFLAMDRGTMFQNVLLGIGTPQYNPVSIPVQDFFSGRRNTCDDFIAVGLATAETCKVDAEGRNIWTLDVGLPLNVIYLPAVKKADGSVHQAVVEQLSCLNNFAGCLEKAKALLDAEGVVDTDGDGIRNIPANFGGLGNPGRNFEVQVVTNTGNTIRENYDLIICDGWNAIGVKCSATTTSFPTLVDQLLGGTFTGFITIGLTGGDPAGAINVVPCGTTLHMVNVTEACVTDDEKILEEAWMEGFTATTVEKAQAGFDKFQELWAEHMLYLHIAALNGLYAQRIDQIANTGRATNANTDVMFRCDLPGQSPDCSVANAELF